MSKQTVLSQKYVRRMKLGYSFCWVFTGGLAVVFILLPFFVKLPPGSGTYTLGGASLLVTLTVLFGMRLSSLLENDAIYRAITKQTEENADESK